MSDKKRRGLTRRGLFKGAGAAAAAGALFRSTEGIAKEAPDQARTQGPGKVSVAFRCNGKEQKVVAPKRKATRVQVTQGLVNVRISHEGKLLKNLSTRRRGNYVVMFYTDADGEKQNVTFYDRRFVIGN